MKCNVVSFHRVTFLSRVPGIVDPKVECPEPALFVVDAEIG